MTETLSQWKAIMKEMIDGVQAELGSATPTKTRIALHTFRKRVDENLDGRKRKRKSKRLEQELDAFFESKRYLHAAVSRYIMKKLRPALKAYVAAMVKARRVLARCKRPRDFSN